MQNRLQALKWDPMAIPRPQGPDVQDRNAKLVAEMHKFQMYLDVANSSYNNTLTKQDIYNYIDAVCFIGVLPSQDTV